MIFAENSRVLGMTLLREATIPKDDVKNEFEMKKSKKQKSSSIV